MAKVCKYLAKKGEEWNTCVRLGPVRPKTCITCVYNKNNKKEKKKASKYYRL